MHFTISLVYKSIKYTLECTLNFFLFTDVRYKLQCILKFLLLKIKIYFCCSKQNHLKHLANSSCTYYHDLHIVYTCTLLHMLKQFIYSPPTPTLLSSHTHMQEHFENTREIFYKNTRVCYGIGCKE